MIERVEEKVTVVKPKVWKIIMPDRVSSSAKIEIVDGKSKGYTVHPYAFEKPSIRIKFARRLAKKPHDPELTSGVHMVAAKHLSAEASKELGEALIEAADQVLENK